jgi:ATP-dependent RNA helicase UAP56/SUB2
MDLLDTLDFNQVIIFCSKKQRAMQLQKLLAESNFPCMVITGGNKMDQPERIKRIQVSGTYVCAHFVIVS